MARRGEAMPTLSPAPAEERACRACRVPIFPPFCVDLVAGLQGRVFASQLLRRYVRDPAATHLPALRSGVTAPRSKTRFYTGELF
jgi:hypothetical protein